MAAEIGPAVSEAPHVEAASMRPRRMAAEIPRQVSRGRPQARRPASMRPRRMAAEIPFEVAAAWSVRAVASMRPRRMAAEIVRRPLKPDWGNLLQ